MASIEEGERRGESTGGEGAGTLCDDSLQERRFIIIGKTGNGKSSVRDLLLNQPHFRVASSSNESAKATYYESANFRTYKIKVLDTPDICHLRDLNEDEAQREVSTWKALTSPKEHAILLAVECDAPYTHEEHESFLLLKKLWGGDSLSRRLIVVFISEDKVQLNVDEFLKQKTCPELEVLLGEASHRSVGLHGLGQPDKAKEDDQHLCLLTVVDKMDAEVLKEEERRLMGIHVCP